MLGRGGESEVARVLGEALFLDALFDSIVDLVFTIRHRHADR